MALDVHILANDEQPTCWPVCQFEEPVHNAIFFDGALQITRCPLLSRMIDYYADARYRTQELSALLGELEKVLPKFSDQPDVHRVLSRFRDACQDAASQGKQILCFCD